MNIKINTIVQLKIDNTKMQVIEIKNNIAKCCWMDSENKKHTQEFDINLLVVSDINSLMPSLVIDGKITQHNICR